MNRWSAPAWVGRAREIVRSLPIGMAPGRTGQLATSAESERQRRRKCEAVLSRFLGLHGYIAPVVATKDELERLISSGITAAELARVLGRRVESLPGVAIGRRRIGRQWHPVRIPQSWRRRHIVTCGKSGTGKTTGVCHLTLADMHAGHGLGHIALEPELVYEELLLFVPSERWDDVVVIDPGDFTRPVPFNPLHLEPGEDLDLKASQLHVTLKRLCAEEGATGAPRMELILSQGIYALLPIEGATLLDLERLVDRQDPSFRQSVIAQTADERTRHFWSTTYESFPKDAHLSLLNRVGRFLRPKAVRNLLCQPGPRFNLRKAMDEGKIVLIVLSDGLLGEDTAALLAQLFAAQFQLAAMSRADTPPEFRRPFFLYLDEAQRSAGLAGASFEQMFSRARKYALGLNLAFQHFGQMPESLVRDMLGTAGSLISFQVGATDARRLSRELVGEVNGRLVSVEPTELVSLPIGQAICRIGRSVFRLHTLPPRTGGSEEARAEILRRSRERFGISPVSLSQSARRVCPAVDLRSGDAL
jgi:hypothetical protein